MKWVVHDVLQSSHFSYAQRCWLGKPRDIREKLLVAFKDEMEQFADTEVTLLCLGEGVDNKEWVDYIKAHPKWKIQSHGMYHVHHNMMSLSDLRMSLKESKARLEDTFGTHVTEFYCPFNIYNDNTMRVAAECGMREVRGYRKPSHYMHSFARAQRMDFHYWVPSNMRWVRLIKHYQEPRPTFIIGAPRSGTTAYMRWLRDKTPRCIALKEREHIWKPKFNRARYYAQKLADNGRDILIDKNCRNSMRLEQIQKEFPQAAVHHVIRDGRAVAYSWWKWAQKTKKKDQTLVGAARQWVDYLTYIREHLFNAIEVRYEDLCEQHEYFKNCNYKWHQELSTGQKLAIEAVQAPMLKKLGYKCAYS